MPARKAPSASDRPALSVRKASPRVNSRRFSVKSSGDLRPATHWNHGRIMRCPTNSKKPSTTVAFSPASPSAIPMLSAPLANAGIRISSGTTARSWNSSAPKIWRPCGVWISSRSARSFDTMAVDDIDMMPPNANDASSGKPSTQATSAVKAMVSTTWAPTKTVLWCYLRNSAFKKDKDYMVSADLTGQANHLGVTIQADIIKQKLPENNGGFKAMNNGDSSYGKFDKRIYTDLCSDHPIDLTRYQVANCYMGRAGLINSGGASGANDFEDAVATAVINKRAGGTGLISGRKAFQRPMAEGARLLNTIQDVYLAKEITI